MEAQMTHSLNGTKWRHKVRGTEYEIVDDDASIQISSTGNDELEAILEDEAWFAYRPVNGHKLYFRMGNEFLDGRFEQIDVA
jgi:hypothetical protein